MVFKKEKKVTEEEKKATNVLDFSFVIIILSFVSVFFSDYQDIIFMKCRDKMGKWAVAVQLHRQRIWNHDKII